MAHSKPSDGVYTREEVSKHNREGDLWIVIDSIVYDLSKFVDMHPGGAAVLLSKDIAGQEATAAFYGLHRGEVLQNSRYAAYAIGSITGEERKIMAPRTGQLSQVPYAESMSLTPSYKPSPYFKPSHYAVQKAMREFVDFHVYPDAQACEASGKRADPRLMVMMAENGLHAMRQGPGKHLKGRTLLGGAVSPEEFDHLHEMIICQELSRMQAKGYENGFQGGTVIGLPPILKFANPKLAKEVSEKVFAGKATVCLAITEPFAGSDVAGLKTTAVMSEDGKHFIVNGSKKWITNGMHADYFTVGCRSEKGLTVLLVPRQEGVETRPVKTAYSSAAGTAYITFKDVKVPIDHLLGKEHDGLRVILANFNHERWMIICGNAGATRIAVEETLKWTCQRRAFGTPLIAQPVIRNKLAAMIAKCESTQAWLEAVTYQMCNMTHDEISQKLAGQISFLKMQSTRFAREIAQEAVMMFGGRGLTTTGMGKHIQAFHQASCFDAVLGGAEDVLADLGVRRAIRDMPEQSVL